jgi:tRNA (guanine37-N1)-methyltransferase
VLSSGDHAAIERWRRMQSVGRTWLRRPDLIEGAPLDAGHSALLVEFLSRLREGAQCGQK